LTVSDTTTAYEDGNALAGPLSEIFAIDVTTADAQCAGCGSSGALARLQVFSHAPGFVARCPECASVVLRFVRAPDAGWLDVRGAVRLRIPLPGGG
jgi:Family of unknown function (DUF6510)